MRLALGGKLHATNSSAVPAKAVNPREQFGEDSSFGTPIFRN